MKNNNFAGFDDWVPIFFGGKQTDGNGVEHDGDDLIEKAVRLFDPTHHEAPITVGHPKDNSPAFGWVEGLKSAIQKAADGSTVSVLMAKFKQVVPEFAQAVKDGLFKKRSASFYPDGRLRHVGFLGGMPPAVKGLADLKFKEGEKEILFADFLPPTQSMSAQHEPAENPRTEKGGRMPDTYTVEELQAQLKAERDRLTAEFAEKNAAAEAVAKTAREAEVQRLREFEEHKKALKAELEAEFVERNRKNDIQRYIEKGQEEGAIIPAWVKMGLAQFMESLPAVATIEFGEGDQKKADSAYGFFLRFLAELPKTVNFSEVAARTGIVDGGGSAAASLDALTAKKMATNPSMGYVAAFCEVQNENPELANEYAADLRKARR